MHDRRTLSIRLLRTRTGFRCGRCDAWRFSLLLMSAVCGLTVAMQLWGSVRSGCGASCEQAAIELPAEQRALTLHKSLILQPRIAVAGPGRRRRHVGLVERV